MGFESLRVRVWRDMTRKEPKDLGARRKAARGSVPERLLALRGSPRVKQAEVVDAEREKGRKREERRTSEARPASKPGAAHRDARLSAHASFVHVCSQHRREMVFFDPSLH